MKYLILGLFFILPSSLSAQQKDCVYVQEAVDSLGTYKATREYVMHERNFGNSTAYLFFSLIQDNGVPVLGVQLIQKSADFMKASCFDKGSKVYLQLDNGKVVTLRYVGEGSCSAMVPVPDEHKSSRVLSGNFVFLKGNFEDLALSPLNLIRIKFATETLDYPARTELVSELTKETYRPSRYFLEFLHCVK